MKKHNFDQLKFDQVIVSQYKKYANCQWYLDNLNSSINFLRKWYSNFNQDQFSTDMISSLKSKIVLCLRLIWKGIKRFSIKQINAKLYHMLQSKTKPFYPII